MKTLHRIKGLAHDLVVTREGNTVTLWGAPGIRHSVLDLGEPHMPGLEYARNTLLAFAFTPQAESFLVLGLGGGSIIKMIFAARPAALVEAVEIEPAIPELARQFFRVGDLPHFQIHIADAAAHLAGCAKQYDVIIVDAYVRDMYPRQCATREFFESARRALTGEGVLVVNWMSGDPDLYRKILSNLEASIGQAWILRGTRSRNTLVFAPLSRTTRTDLRASADRFPVDLPFASFAARLAHRLRLNRGSS